MVVGLQMNWNYYLKEDGLHEIGCLAGIKKVGKHYLYNIETIPKGRDIWHHKPNEKVCSVDTIQHSGRLR